MKTCKKCGLEKPINDYTVDVRYKDGRYPWCADCRRAWRQGRKDKQRELHANWRDKNREHVREEANAYYHRHKEEIAPKRREYDRKRWAQNAEHRQKKHDQERERYETRPEVRERKREAHKRRYHSRYYSDPEYRQRRLERNKTFVHLRRRRVRDAGKYSVEEWRALCERYGHRCLKCGEQKPLTPDHVVPLSRGGMNTIDNIQPLCLTCNLQKHAKTIDYRPGENA